jgi:tetratricopeptide (TPR) repeat protein
MRFSKVKSFITLVVVLAAAGLVFAGAQARIEGHVTDSKGNPVANAEITITSPEVSSFHRVVTADEGGVFKFLILDATRHYLFHVAAPGFQPQERPFKVAAGSTDNVFEFTLNSLQEAAAQGTVDILEQPGYKEMEEARKLYNAGDKEAALAKFKEAAAAKPDLVPALAAIAELSYVAGDYQAAIDGAEKCLEQDDESLECLAIAANAAQSIGDNEAYAGYMARYKGLNPEDPTILYNSAAEFLNKMDDDGARPLLEKCLEADPDFPQCNFEYGMLLLRTGDMEGAKSHLEKYLEVAPDGPDAATAQETIKYL